MTASPATSPLLSPLRRARRALRWLRELVHHLRGLIRGARAFRSTGQNSEAGYFGMLGLYYLTSGASNDLLHAAVAAARGREKFPHANGVLGNLTGAELATIDRDLRANGFYRFPRLASAALCDRLTAFARKTPGRLHPRPDGAPAYEVFDASRPLSPNYRFEEKTLLELPDVQELMTDFSLLSVAQNYLSCSPILDIVAMWWSAHTSDVPDSEAAQLYHFDMDRLKWIKFFLYLTDVTPDTGPHCYVAGTHRRFTQPRSLLERGYARIPDEEITRHYGASAQHELTGPRGTLLAVDTRGFHKGKVLSRGCRLLLQLEFSDSLFGGAFARTPWDLSQAPAARAVVSQFPRVYEKYPRVEAAEKLRGAA